MNYENESCDFRFFFHISHAVVSGYCSTNVLLNYMGNVVICKFIHLFAIDEIIFNYKHTFLHF